MSRLTGISNRGIYSDLLRKFRDEGHNVYILSPEERGHGSWFTVHGLRLIEQDGVHILSVKTLNLQKTNVIEKGIGQILVENQYKRAIKKCLNNVKFDLILYSTPPITFPKVIAYLKRKNPQAQSYLLLKDIFPQNAVDLGMLTVSVHGSWFTVHGWIERAKYQLYKYFRKKEKNLYALSDYIGCMSPANVEYVLKHNPEIAAEKVEVAPNSIELDVRCKKEDVRGIREKYNLPTDKPIFIYGGNLGKPQGIPFLIECLEANSDRTDCHFIVVGSGTEHYKLESWYRLRNPKAVTLLDKLPKEDYDMLARSCDVGMIFLDHRFTIPNYPSRLLPYLENKMPIIAATDPNCDTGKIAEENGYGFWCESNSVEAFTAIVDKMIHSDRNAMGEKGYEFLCKNYLVSNTYQAIIKHV
jgi:glycosyltransferase involved in cell wall biosynthesis